MKDTSFINYIEIHGDEIQQKELSDEQRKELAGLLSDCFMKVAGYMRREQEGRTEKGGNEKE